MITASDEFKALYFKKQGVEQRLRVRYKLRYWNGSAFVLQSSYTVLEEFEIIGVGEIHHQLDPILQVIYRMGVMTFRFNNERNQWRQSAAPPSFFAADATAANGYRLYRSQFQFQLGYKLNAGTFEWLTQFTGRAINAKMDSRSAVAEITVAAEAFHLLERSDPARSGAGTNTVFTLENCIPAVGDNVNKAFESTSVGVSHLTDVQVNAVAITQGSGWRVANNNHVAGPADTGRLSISLNSAPLNLETVKCSGLKWLVNQAIDTLVGLICDEAGVVAGARSISTVVLPTSAAGSQTIDSLAQFQAGTVRTNIYDEDAQGFIAHRWRLIDGFTDNGLSWWTKRADTPVAHIVTVAAGVLTLQSPVGSLQAQYNYVDYDTPTPGITATGTWRFNLRYQESVADGNDSYALAQFIRGAAAPYQGYAIIADGNLNKFNLIRLDDGQVPSVGYVVLVDCGALDTNTHEWIVSRSAAGLFSVRKDGVLQGTATDATYDTVYGFGVRCMRFPGTNGDWTRAVLDGVYWNPGAYSAFDGGVAAVWESAELDLLAAPAAWGQLTRTEILNGGTLVYKTAGSNAPGGPYEAYVAIGVDGTIQSSLRRYFKVRVEITPPDHVFTSPECYTIVVNFLTTNISVALANFAGKNGLTAVEALAAICDYEAGTDTAGNFFFRAKPVSAGVAVEFNQENGVIEVLDWDDGRDSIINAGRVRSGIGATGVGAYVSEYDGTSAAEVSPTSEAEYGRCLPPGGEVNLATFLIANDVNISLARARLLYERNYLPKIKIRATIWLVPWLQIGDKVRLDFFDDPILKQTLIDDPLWDMESGRFYAGEAENVLARQLDMKVLEYKPNYDTNMAEVYLEEIL